MTLCCFCRWRPHFSDCCCCCSCQFYFRFHINFIANAIYVVDNNETTEYFMCKNGTSPFSDRSKGSKWGSFFPDEFLKCFASILLSSNGNFFIGKKIIEIDVVHFLASNWIERGILHTWILRNEGKREEKEMHPLQNFILLRGTIFPRTILTVLNPLGIKMFAYTILFSWKKNVQVL